MNVASITEAVKPLNAWIHEGDNQQKVDREACLRTLGQTCSSPEERDQCPTLVMQALVDYSKGSGKKKVVPYEGNTGSSTTAFLNVPTGTLACTLSRMYPFAVNPEEAWDRLRKIRLYPFTQIWPRTVMKRFTKFNETVYTQYEEMKKSYEKSGGVYHGDSDDEAKASDEDPEALEEKRADVELACDQFF